MADALSENYKGILNQWLLTLHKGIQAKYTEKEVEVEKGKRPGFKSSVAVGSLGIFSSDKAYIRKKDAQQAAAREAVAGLSVNVEAVLGGGDEKRVELSESLLNSFDHIHVLLDADNMPGSLSNVPTHPQLTVHAFCAPTFERESWSTVFKENPHWRWYTTAVQAKDSADVHLAAVGGMLTERFKDICDRHAFVILSKDGCMQAVEEVIAEQGYTTKLIRTLASVQDASTWNSLGPQHTETTPSSHPTPSKLSKRAQKLARKVARRQSKLAHATDLLRDARNELNREMKELQYRADATSTRKLARKRRREQREGTTVKRSRSK